MDNQVLKVIKERRSIRKYKKEQVPEDLLRQVLEAGTFAPTSKGRQNPFIVAVQDEEMKARLVALNAGILGTNSNPYFDAPTLVFVFADPTLKNYLQDGSLVLGNMMLAAQALGLASCWINREIEMFNTEEGRTLMKQMGLPDGLGGIGALALGYADEPLPEPKPRKKDYYRIIR